MKRPHWMAERPQWLAGFVWSFPWAAALLLAVAIVAMLSALAFIPLVLYPDLSAAQLDNVPNGEARITLQQAQGQLQNDARSTLLQAFAGLVLVAGVVSTWRQLQLSRHGQITERVTHAVDQLASNSIDVRLGGLYALERVAKSTYGERATVTAILTAFIRTHAPWTAAPNADHDHNAMPAFDGGFPSLRERAEHVQAALDILANRPRSGGERPVDLSFADLRKADMHGQDWRYLICRKASLARALLNEARLEVSHLDETDLRGADLSGARLFDTKLNSAHLQNANLHEADLRGADLTRTCLRGADLRGADLTGTCLRGADLRGADLTETCLDGADLSDIQVDERTTWPSGFNVNQHRNLPSGS